MGVSDPLADGLTRIRNASRAKHPTADVRPSKLMQRILDVLKQEGFIRTYKAVGDVPAQRVLRVYLKYVNRVPAISQVVRISKCGQRQYRGAANLPRVLRGSGIAIISTSQGVMADRDAYRQRVGGEVLCYVW